MVTLNRCEQAVGAWVRSPDNKHRPFVISRDWLTGDRVNECQPSGGDEANLAGGLDCLLEPAYRCVCWNQHDRADLIGAFGCGLFNEWCDIAIWWIQPGEWKGWRHCVVYRPGQIPKNDIIVLAQHLMQHGVVGKAKVRQLQRHETGERITEFKAFDYISAARSHFGMNRAEASQLTMTEFQMLLAAKYPEQKGFTREEYDAVADAYLARRAKRARQLAL